MCRFLDLTLAVDCFGGQPRSPMASVPQGGIQILGTATSPANVSVFNAGDGVFRVKKIMEAIQIAAEQGLGNQIRKPLFPIEKLVGRSVGGSVGRLPPKIPRPATPPPSSV